MSKTRPTSAFLELLKKSRLFAQADLTALVEQYRLLDRKNGRGAAGALVLAGRLTRWQAQRLLSGRYRGFFIDGYRLLELLGMGGMGRLFLAREEETGRQVALKVLSERFQDDRGMLARLQLEARAGTRLDHPNVVRTYRLARSQDGFDRHYIVMEFVPGIGLEELVHRRGPVPWAQACDIIAQAAAGLQHAHEKGLVHRDLKPANLLIDREGRVKVADFGLALIDDEGENEFSLHMIFGHDCVGSADFMAPEQTLDSSAVDARADLYSLGCTFYSILTGSLPFPYGSAHKTMEAQRTRPATPIGELAKGIPREVTAVVERLMAKRPEDRFQTADEVRRALEPLAVREPVDFDYATIIAARGADAKRRTESMRRRDTKRRNTTIVERPTPPAIAAKRRRRRGARVEAGPLPVDPGRVVAESGAHNVPAVAAADAITGTVLPQAARLVPVNGGEPLALAGSRLLIGRAPECDLRIASSRVSSRHCELRFEGSWWRVTDLGSKNGTRVNGVDVRDQMLWPGDVLTIAEHVHYRIESQSERKPARRAWLWLLLAALASGLAGGAWALWP